MSPRVLLVLGIGAVALTVWTATAEPPKPAAAAPVPKDKPAKKVVPLDTVYSTPALADLKYLRAKNPEIYGQHLIDTLSVAEKVGLSSAFLVRGQDLKEVIRGTHRVFALGWDPSEVVPGVKDQEEIERDGDIWVCAFLGSKPSQPPVFALDRVEIEGKTVRVVRKKELVGGLSNDSVPYLVWANLGRLPSGSYQVELVEIVQKQLSVVTARKVLVLEIKQ